MSIIFLTYVHIAQLIVLLNHIFTLFHLLLLAASQIPLPKNSFRGPETRINPAFPKIFLPKKASRKCLFYFSLCPFAPPFDTFFVISFVKTGKALSIRYRDNPAATDYPFLSFFRTIFPRLSFFLFTFLISFSFFHRPLMPGF